MKKKVWIFSRTYLENAVNYICLSERGVAEQTDFEVLGAGEDLKSDDSSSLEHDVDIPDMPNHVIRKSFLQVII